MKQELQLHAPLSWFPRTKEQLDALALFRFVLEVENV